jgi:glycosyltransferase involved in cell wall biosynthesis
VSETGLMSAQAIPAAPRQRIVLLGAYAPSLINFRGPLIAEMARRGHEVFALAPDLDSEIAGQLRALGATPISISLRRASMNPLRAVQSARRIRAIFRGIRPDAVFAYTITPIVLGAAPARAVGARFFPIVTGLGYAFLPSAGPLRVLMRLSASLLYRRAFRSARIAFFQNDDDLADFKRIGILKKGLRTVLIAGSGVDLVQFKKQPVPTEMIFLMIARFLKAKGILEYGKAAARLKKDFPEVVFRLAGWFDQSPDAVQKADLEQIALAGVDCLGKLDDVRPSLADCAVYVLPSYREGTPRSVLEAMAVGRAIITTDAPGCRETVLEGRNGFLVPPMNADALYLAMRRFIENPSLAATMGPASRQLAEEKFDVVNVNRVILEHAGL